MKIKWNKKIFFQSIIILNIIYLMGLVGYYGFRLVHYYMEENGQEKSANSLAEQLTLSKNLVLKGDGLHEIEDNYYYIGKNVNNYVSYSGVNYRIIKITDDNEIVMTSEDTLTSLAWGKSNDYYTSYVRSWLNTTDGAIASGVFEKTLEQSDTYLKKGNWCVDKIDNIKKVTCKTRITSDRIGLISFQDYQRSGGKNGFLNNGTNFWTTNGVLKKDSAWYISAAGNFNEGNNQSSYGVRPVIVLKSGIGSLKGDGTLASPYKVDEVKASQLEAVPTGMYVRYSGMNFRVLEKDQDRIKLVLDGYLKSNGEEVTMPFSSSSSQYSTTSWGSIGYYLNRTFYNTLNHPEYLVNATWNIGNYDEITGFDYKNITTDTVQAKIGLLEIGDLFFSDYPATFTMNGTSGTNDMIYTTYEKGKLYLDTISSNRKIRPVLAMQHGIAVTGGEGTKTSPYIIGEA